MKKAFTVAKPQVFTACELLPLDTRILLQQSALIDPDHKIGDSLARSKALDAAIKNAHQRNPQFFKEENSNESETAERAPRLRTNI